ncbi:hypothetical protein ACFVTM_03855 [Arthrobacter sp. NPDC058130]|uniref:hypothetical protein n=1 Tax=Arthrobacter sp. NPDC058130 TaxID=3346353 RepID=UPI0036ED2EC6
MNQFSVLSNPSIAGSAPTYSDRGVESGRAKELLTSRQFHVCGDNVLNTLQYVDDTSGGVFLTGPNAAQRMNALRRLHPTIPMIVEPRSITHYIATPEQPFVLPPDNLFHTGDLAGALDDQRAMGSDLAITPTGQIASGDSASLKAALFAANALDREDTLLALPLAANWLSDEAATRQLVKAIDRSRHPVALTFIDPANPLGSLKRMRAYRRLIHETTGTVLAYRVDLFGFDALAGGAIASAIGAYPAARRLTPVGRGGSSADPEDKSPHMLIGDILRFTRSKHMRRHWFAEAPPIRCFCMVCRGDDIDRLYGDQADRIIGHQHNVLEIGRLFSVVGHLPPAQMRSAWAKLVAGARDAYPQLETHIGAPVRPTRDLDVWATPVT